MISYSQNFEDVILERAFRGQRNGFYVDVGAWHPNSHSVTKHFYQHGWHGINVEPSAHYFRLLSRRRTRDTNLNVAVGSSEGVADFFEVPTTGMSSLAVDVKKYALRMGLATERRLVRVVSLNSIFEKYCKGREVNFLKIDVEGSEGAVIRSLNWREHRPIIVLAEAVHPESRIPTWGDWEPHLLGAEYTFVWFDGLNRFYIRNEDIELKAHFVVPPGIIDGFQLARGNSLCAGRLLGLQMRLREVIPERLFELLRRAACKR